MRTPLGWALVVAVALVPPALATARDEPSGIDALRLARAAFHTGSRPPYIVYTVDRRDTLGGVPDFTNIYTERIWCRTSDGAALVRRVGRDGRAGGDLEFVVVRFDDRVDPGPPTADLFEPARPRDRRGAPIDVATPASAASEPPEIGHVVARFEVDFRVARNERDGTQQHLVLEALRDPERNRVREVWLDPATGSVTRVILADHLYTPVATIPERFDVRLGRRDGIPIVEAIHGETERVRYARTDDLMHTVDYRYREVRFAETLPGWYFDPRTYGAHRAVAPER